MLTAQDVGFNLDAYRFAPDADEVSAEEPLPPEFSEDAIAQRFSAKHVDDMRHVAAWSCWLMFDGVRWQKDLTQAAFDKSRIICRDVSSGCDDKDKGKAARITSKATVAAVLSLASCDRRQAATTDQWDADPWLLNTPTGTVNLVTGKCQPHDRNQHLTKVTAAGPSSDRPKLWLSFLDRITDGNQELKSYLQRWFGYCLTGITREHALGFHYGTGANGKSVLLNTFSRLLGDYATTAPADTFTASSHSLHPTDMAGLRGARLVTAIETEEGRWWAEAKIKSLTGGDKISARFMRQDFFEYIPQFKLIIAGNHKPGLKNVDVAMKRRIHMVPFNVTIPESERDLDLAEKLKAEYPGILQWAIDGCLAWQREGLNPPPAVKDTTEEYLTSEDVIGRWIDERCLTGNHWTASSALYASYTTWCEESRERPRSQKRFTEDLSTRGFKWERTKKARGFEGIGLSQNCNG